MKKNNDLSKIAKESGSDEVLWPGDKLLKPGIVPGRNSKEKTRLPKMLNDGKKYDGTAQT